MPLLMRSKSTPKIVRRADMDVAILRESRRATSGGNPPALLLRETPFVSSTKVACHPKPVRAKGGGDGGIRTLDNHP
jgi:hypothetical protein